MAEHHYAYGNYLTIIGFSGIISTVILSSLKLTGGAISEQTTPSVILNTLLLVSLSLIAIGMIMKARS